jgi:hypothetical protein
MAGPLPSLNVTESTEITDSAHTSQVRLGSTSLSSLDASTILPGQRASHFWMNRSLSLPARAPSREHLLLEIGSSPETREGGHSNQFEILPAQPYHNEPNFSIFSSLWNHRAIWLLAVFTCAAVAFTIFFAYNSSLDIPRSQQLIFRSPQRTILALNILSQVTIFLLGLLTDSMFARVRWGFASSGYGISVLSFLALSPSTNYLGVLVLILSSLHLSKLSWNSKVPFSRDGHCLWGFQR